VTLANPSDILLPLVGPFHPDSLKGKVKRLTLKVKVEKGKTVTAIGNGRAQTSQPDTPSKLHLRFMTSLPLIHLLINGGTIRTSAQPAWTL
jgi:hypothetical protein